MQLVFTTVYSRRVGKLLSDRERRAAEDEIAADPLRWPAIRGTGGVRKARAARGTSGKRGGVRIIYFFWSEEQTLYFLTIYSKGSKSDLTAAERAALRKVVKSLRR